jgi:hypothetical protein
MRPIHALAAEALTVQDACNLSGVVHAFAEVLDDLWQHAHAAGQGTNWVNCHPITRAFVGKLASLSRLQDGDGTYRQVVGLAGQAA